jgi:hypothetical protein
MTRQGTTTPAVRRWLGATALGRARGTHRVLLVATCLSLVLAAIGDEATGYDGPGPLIDLAVAAVVAVLWWRFVPLLAVVTGLLFVYGGLATPDFMARLVDPGHLPDFAAGWLQMLGFAAAVVFAVAAITAPRFSRGTVLSHVGLLVGILGLFVQWVADPAKFADGQRSFGITFPPGILFIFACGVLMLATGRWWWHPVFAVLIAFWIVVMGTVANQLPPNLVSHNAGTVAGTVVMSLGLTFAGATGGYAMLTGRRSRRRRAA